MHVLKQYSKTITIEKSKFICYICPCKTEEEYKEYLLFFRKKYFDADHICSALICNNIKKSSDAGEPSGTAGTPMLSALEKRNIDNVCAIVIRYFGGIKLGSNGLIRAYSDSVNECLDLCELYEYETLDKYELTFTYESSSKIEHLLLSNTYVFDKEYGVNIKYVFGIKNPDIYNQLLSLTKGQKPIYIERVDIDKVVK